MGAPDAGRPRSTNRAPGSGEGRPGSVAGGGPAEGPGTVPPTAADTALLRVTLDHIFDGVLIVDRVGQIQYANPSALALVRRRAEELLGRRMDEVFTDIVGSGFDRWLEHTWRTEQPASVEAYYAPLEGWFEVRAFPSPDGMTFYLRDITQQRSATEAQDQLVQRLEDALGRQKQVEEVVTALAEALTVEEVSAIVLDQAARTLDTRFAGIALVEPDEESLRFVSLHPLPARVVARWSVVALDGSTPLAEVVRTRQASYHGSRREIAAAHPDPTLRGVTEASGAHAFANVPLLVGDRTLGVLSMSWSAERSFDAEERTFLNTLASQCAQAVERAQLIARQHDVADTLQQAMLPDQLPVVPGTVLAACYLPATAGLTVGGDWYDALTLPDGRVMLAVGDVAGHGVQAAAVMGQIRNALRGFVIDGAGPATALAKLDTFVDLAGHGLFATAVIALYEPASGALRWANAGHPPPYVASGPAGRFLVGGLRSPLGVRPLHVTDDQQEILAPGDTLVLYTDGLIERRQEDLDVGLARLAGAITGAGPPTGTAWCVALVDRLLTDEARYDDVCVLAVHRAEASATRRPPRPT